MEQSEKNDQMDGINPSMGFLRGIELGFQKMFLKGVVLFAIDSLATGSTVR